MQVCMYAYLYICKQYLPFFAIIEEQSKHYYLTLFGLMLKPFLSLGK